MRHTRRQRCDTPAASVDGVHCHLCGRPIDDNGAPCFGCGLAARRPAVGAPTPVPVTLSVALEVLPGAALLLLVLTALLPGDIPEPVAISFAAVAILPGIGWLVSRPLRYGMPFTVVHGVYRFMMVALLLYYAQQLALGARATDIEGDPICLDYGDTAAGQAECLSAMQDDAWGYFALAGILVLIPVLSGVLLALRAQGLLNPEGRPFLRFALTFELLPALVTGVVLTGVLLPGSAPNWILWASLLALAPGAGWLMWNPPLGFIVTLIHGALRPILIGVLAISVVWFTSPETSRHECSGASADALLCQTSHRVAFASVGALSIALPLASSLALARVYRRTPPAGASTHN